MLVCVAMRDRRWGLSPISPRGIGTAVFAASESNAEQSALQIAQMIKLRNDSRFFFHHFHQFSHILPPPVEGKIIRVVAVRTTTTIATLRNLWALTND
jgi:hypothetical protein